MRDGAQEFGMTNFQSPDEIGEYLIRTERTEYSRHLPGVCSRRIEIVLQVMHASETVRQQRFRRRVGAHAVRPGVLRMVDRVIDLDDEVRVGKNIHNRRDADSWSQRIYHFQFRSWLKTVRL